MFLTRNNFKILASGTVVLFIAIAFYLFIRPSTPFVNNIFIFIAALFMVVRGATLATKYAARLSESYRLSTYTIGFIVVAIISILPETFIAINSTISAVPSFGLGVLFGSNIADLTLVFAIIIMVANRGLKVESKMLKNHTLYPFLLLLPVLLGFDGYYTRIEGITLILTGGIFYYRALRNGSSDTPIAVPRSKRYQDFLLLLFSMVILLVGSHFTVTAATAIAESAGINSILIGMLIVGLGTTMPELFFSVQSAKRRDDSLAIGDLLGTVLADATIVVGIIALITPFAFPRKIVYITGICMVLAAFVLFMFMRSGKTITRKEAGVLFLFWITFVCTEFIASSMR